MLSVVVFFFFKQKTAYEMRISDWSSDVCSSDLRIRLRANAIMMLQRRELLRAGDELAGELGKPFVEMRAGESIEGRLLRRVDLASGRFVLVEHSRELTLLQWRPVLDRQIGRPIAGGMRSDGVSWSCGRGRSGPQIS